MSTNQPAHFPKNLLVEHLLSVQRINAEKGAPAGRSYSGGGSQVDAGIPTHVVSAAMNREVEARPLSPEEIADRDAAARKLGILPPLEEENETYENLDSALAAGASVKPPITDPAPSVMEARRQSVQQTWKETEYTSRAVGRSPARMIDFKRVQSIDLQRGVAFVDDFEIQLPAEDVRTMKKHILDLAVDFVTRQLAAALAEVMEVESGNQAVPVRVDGLQSRGYPNEDMSKMQRETSSRMESIESGSATDPIEEMGHKQPGT